MNIHFWPENIFEKPSVVDEIIVLLRLPNTGVYLTNSYARIKNKDEKKKRLYFKDQTRNLIRYRKSVYIYKHVHLGKFFYLKKCEQTQTTTSNKNMTRRVLKQINPTSCVILFTIHYDTRSD